MLLAEDGHIFLTCLQLVVTWVTNMFGNLLPYFFDMSSTSGNTGAKSFQEFGPRFLACHVPNIACHGVSISRKSMSSMSCRVIILRVSVSVPCRGHPDGCPLRFLAVSFVAAPCSITSRDRIRRKEFLLQLVI